VRELVGRHLSTPKPNIVFRGSAKRILNISGLVAILDAKTQFLYLRSRFFINGESFAVRPAQRHALAELADRRSAPGRRLARAGLERLILQWHRNGYLRLESAP